MNPAIVFLALVLSAAPKTVPEGEELLVDIAPLHSSFLFDLKYATTDNFFGQKAYEVAVCALRKSVADNMVRAQEWLSKHHPGLKLLFKDCYRPDRAQWILWDAVKGTDKAAYVANPNGAMGSIHSRGAAVDVTLAGADGNELDMGTPYDTLSPLAEPKLEAKHLKEKKLSEKQVENRLILRKAMSHAGMRVLPNEWWHFNAGTQKEIAKKFSRLDVPLSELQAR